MRLRLAKKIMKAVGTPRQVAYSDWQIGAANARVGRTQTMKEANAFWDELMATQRRLDALLIADVEDTLRKMAVERLRRSVGGL